MDLRKAWDLVKDKKNVLGYSTKLQPRIKADKVLKNILCFRVYVSQKIRGTNAKKLLGKDFIPSILELEPHKYIETDIVDLEGEITAPPPNKTPIENPGTTIDKTKRIRPVELGVSIGNWNITAGSLGMLYTKGKEKYLAGTNAHVGVEYPNKQPKDIVEKRICQPGPYHDQKNKDKNIVGEYYWHDQIIPEGQPSNCTISTLIIKFLNYISKKLGRKTRFKTYYNYENHQDLSLYNYKGIADHILKVADDSLSDEPFIGHLFAGSYGSGIICKVKYAIEKGYISRIQPTEVNSGDKVKGCSFWCNYETNVLDDSGAVRVNYGDFTAFFTDVIIVKNNGTIKGGWSGSGFRKIE